MKRPQDVGKITGRRAAIAATECRSGVPQAEFTSARIKPRVRSEHRDVRTENNVEFRNKIIYYFLRGAVWMSLVCAVAGLFWKEFLLMAAVAIILATPIITAIICALFGVTPQRRLAGLGLLITLGASVSLHFF
jgi:hypothetical protein